VVYANLIIDFGTPPWHKNRSLRSVRSFYQLYADSVGVISLLAHPLKHFYEGNCDINCFFGHLFTTYWNIHHV